MMFYLIMLVNVFGASLKKESGGLRHENASLSFLQHKSQAHLMTEMELDEGGVNYDSEGEADEEELKEDDQDIVDNEDLVDLANQGSDEQASGGVSCGVHSASSCEECVQSNGPSWCYGDCTWNWWLWTCNPL